MPELVCAADDPRWQDERRRGITATDIVTILGLSSYDSPYSLYWRKRGDLPGAADTDRWQLGRYLEPYITRAWIERQSVTAGLKNGALYRSSARPWQAATPDRLVTGLGGVCGVLEVKSWADADRHAWDDTPPPAVRAQVLWQMDVMDVSTGHVGVVFLPSGEFRHYTIEHQNRCDEVCTCDDVMLMRAAGLEFWRRVAGELPPPGPDGSAATLAAVRARFPAPVRGKAVPVRWDLWDGYLTWKAKRDEAEAKMREGEALIREQLGEGTEVEVDGQVVARRIISDQQIKAHVRHMDYIRKLKNGNGSDD